MFLCPKIPTRPFCLGILTRLRAERPRNHASFLGRGKTFSSSLGSIQQPVEWVLGALSSEMDALREQLRTLRETVDSFPTGAASCVEYSLEDEIRKAADTITLVNARLLMLKAQDKQRKLPQAGNPLDLYEFYEVLNSYEEEMANADLRKQVWKNSIEASLIRKIIADAAADEQGTHSDSFQTTANLMEKLVSLNDQLRGVLKEQKDLAQQVIATKQELQQRLQDYKELLVDQEREWQERAVGQERENIQLKKRLELKLEKLNVMRILMVNLLSTSNIDYLQHPEWTKVLIQMQGLKYMESFMPSDTKTQ